MKRIPKYNSETNLQTQIADYLRLQYPDVLFHSDFGSGIKLTIGQAKVQKRQNGSRRAWPDMFIAEQKHWHYDSPCREACDDDCFAGLFIELKKDGTRLKKKNDEWATPHIAEQAETLEKLREKGYKAEFAVGFEEAKQMIDNYLKGAND